MVFIFTHFILYYFYTEGFIIDLFLYGTSVDYGQVYTFIFTFIFILVTSESNIVITGIFLEIC